MARKENKKSRNGGKEEANEVRDRKQTGEVKERGQEAGEQDVGKRWELKVQTGTRTEGEDERDKDEQEHGEE